MDDEPVEVVLRIASEEGTPFSTGQEVFQSETTSTIPPSAEAPAIETEARLSPMEERGRMLMGAEPIPQEVPREETSFQERYGYSGYRGTASIRYTMNLDTGGALGGVYTMTQSYVQSIEDYKTTGNGAR